MIGKRSLIFCLLLHFFNILQFAIVTVTAQSAPSPHRVNDFLADSVFPIPHGNSYQSNSVGVEGPDPSTDNLNRVYHGNLDGRDFPAVRIDKKALLAGGAELLANKWLLRMSKRNLDPIALLYSSEENWFWCSTFPDILKVRSDPDGGFKIIQKIPRKDWDVDLANGDLFHGSYGLLFSDDSYIVPSSKEILRYKSIAPGANSKFELVNTFTLSSVAGVSSSDAIRGLNLLYDGSLVFVTRLGVVGVIDTTNIDNMVSAGSALQLTTTPSKTHQISNSLAVDEQGGIYIVSDSHMFKAQWDSSSNTLTQAWSTGYSTTTNLINGRLGIGSGTTPSILKSSIDNNYYVSIGDGAELMSINTFSCDTGDLVGSVEVKFGDSSRIDSTTENSLTSYNDRIFVTNNDWANENDNYLYEAVISGDAPMGVQQFSFDPTLDVSSSLQETWVRTDVSFPNGIPIVSTPSNTVYDTARFQITQSQWDAICENYYSTSTLKSKLTTKYKTFCKRNGWRALQSGLQDTDKMLDKYGPMLSSFFTGDGTATSLALEPQNIDLKQFKEYSKNKYPRSHVIIEDEFQAASNSIWVWATIGLDWTNGDTTFSQILGTHMKFNTFYAGTTVGPDKSILSGTILGFYKVTNQKNQCTNNAKECAKAAKKNLPWEGNNALYAKRA